MPDMKLPSYFYGDEAMQFTYFRIPCQLITHPRFKHLSTDSKLLYGMLLDRMSLSIKNEWYDDTGRVYIYYTVDEVCSNLNCGRDKAMRLLAELDTGKGVGLIERKKQGQGKPTRIYVKRFTTQEMPPQPEKKPEPPAPPPGVEFADVQKSDFPTSRRRKNPPQEVEEGIKRPVWRCVNRLDYGKTRCKRSPTLDEKPLQQAVLAAVNALMSRKDTLLNDVTLEMFQELAPVPGEVLSLGDIERAIADLSQRFDQLMNETDGEESIQRNLDQFREISEQLALLKQRKAHALGVQAENEVMAKKLRCAATIMEVAPAEVTEWNESIVHQLVEEIKVLSKNEIKVTFRNGAER